MSARVIFTAHADGGFDLASRRTRCALGRGGVIAADAKREGDGATPLGVWTLRRALYRADRTPAPSTRLPVRTIAPDDGWCDAPDDAAYNQPVRLPHRAGAERLWRDDGVYDLLVVLGHNDAPVRPGAGSAIFLHLARPGWEATDGCVALALDDLTALLAHAAPGDALAIRA